MKYAKDLFEYSLKKALSKSDSNSYNCSLGKGPLASVYAILH